MKYKSKEFKKNNYFVLYEYRGENSLNDEDEIICYIESFEELKNKYLKEYRLSNLVHEYNRYNTNIINIIIDNKKYRLATFCDEKVDDLLIN